MLTLPATYQVLIMEKMFYIIFTQFLDGIAIHALTQVSGNKILKALYLEGALSY